MADCACCGEDMMPRTDGETRHAAHEGRNLCTPCYRREDYHGRLDNYPRRTWSRDELMSEWEFLRQDGYTRAQAADRIGVARTALDRAIWRAKAAGDPRAIPGLAGGIYATTEDAIARAGQAVRDDEPATWTPAPTTGRALEHAAGRSA